MPTRRLSPSASPAAGLPPEEPTELEGLEGVEIQIGEDDGGIIENLDGSADVTVGENERATSDFYNNLAEELDEQEMQTLAQELLRKIERDKESRKKRDEQYEEGLRRTGLGQDAPGGASFTGASRVVHPMIAEACVDFAAATMKEIYPPDGPAKTRIEGEQSRVKLEVAKRQQRYLNWQLTEQVSEYPEELEQLLTQLPLGGSQYIKFWFDGTLKRISCEFVPIDDILLPYACSDFYSAQRITHVQRLTQMVYEERVESGFYREVASEEPGQAPDQSKAAKASDKIEGRENEIDNVDGERVVYEISTFAKLSSDGEERHPYLISIDEYTRKVVAIYRNWEEKDEAKTRLDWIVEYGFIAWRGAYKIGLPHLIGGLSAAATGALRALLDSAHVNNMPGFLRLKGARMGGQSKEINPTAGVEIEASAALDDIRKVVLALPYNPPSTVLFELLGWLTEAGKGVVTTAEERIKDASNQMPVGTALALIEQGAKVFSSIHARMHRSQKRSFQIIARLNKQHLSIGEQVSKLGEVLATRKDFSQPLAIIPVSDPNIFSETQRYAQMQMVLQLASGTDKEGNPTASAQLHNLHAVLKRMYELAKIPDFEEFLPPQPKPEYRNAGEENALVMLGEPVKAFPDQHHLAHIEAHMRFMTDPFLGGSGMAAGQTMPALMDHVKEHLAMLYAEMLYQIIEEAIGSDLNKIMQDKRNGQHIDRLIASASKIVHAELNERLQPLGPVIMQILQQIAKMQPPQAMDPSQAVLEAERMKAESAKEKTVMTLQQKEAKEKRDAELKAAELARKAEKEQADLAMKEADTGIKAQGQERDDQRDDAKLAHEREIDHAELALRERELEQRAQEEEAKRVQAAEQEELRVAADLHKDEAGRAAEERRQAADQSFQKVMSDEERAHAQAEADKDRDLQVRSKAVDVASKEASEQRNLKAQDVSQRRELQSKEKLTKEQLKAKAAQAKAKPKGRK